MVKKQEGYDTALLAIPISLVARHMLVLDLSTRLHIVLCNMEAQHAAS